MFNIFKIWKGMKTTKSLSVTTLVFLYFEAAVWIILGRYYFFFFYPTTQGPSQNISSPPSFKLSTPSISLPIVFHSEVDVAVELLTI